MFRTHPYASAQMKIKRRFWFLTAGIAFAALLLLDGVALLIGDGGLTASLTSIAAVPASGVSLDSFRNKMGLAARHQFTVKGPDGIYTLATCFFSDGDDMFLYLFRDKSLIKIVAPSVLERVGDSIDDAATLRSINAIIDAPAVTHKYVLDELNPPPRPPSDNALPALLAIPLGAVTAVRLIPDTLDLMTTRKLLAHYSGFKVDLGMDEANVKRLYGDPSSAFHLPQGDIVYIYYNQREENSSVNEQLTFGGMAVVMSPSGIVTECLSDGFFNPSWKK